MTAKAVKCPYCAYNFIADANQPSTYCPNCKKIVSTAQPKNNAFSIFRSLPKNVKYIIIGVLVVGIVIVFLNMFGILKF